MEEPKILETGEKILVGMRITTTLLEGRESELWRTFRSRASEIPERTGINFFSVKVYGADYSFSSRFDPNAAFDKWAAIEVANFVEVHEDFEQLIIPVGRYAVFIHYGTPAMAAVTFGHIFGSWLPNSDFEVDHRPHFEVLGDKWSPFDPEAEEEVWVPVTTRRQ